MEHWQLQFEASWTSKSATSPNSKIAELYHRHEIYNWAFILKPILYEHVQTLMRLKAGVFTLAMAWQVQKSETGCSDWNQLFFLPDFWASTLSSFLPKFLSKLCWSYESQPTWLLRLHFQFSECFLKLKSTARFNLTSHVIMKSKFVNEKILIRTFVDSLPLAAWAWQQQ